jgi:hypothetical protein
MAMKRNRATDTQPMLDRPMRPAETTDPTRPADRTDPGGPPAMTLPPSGASFPSSVTNMPPSAVATPSATQDEIHEANNLLAAFKERPLAPPAPRPKQRPNSEGGDFVAYSTVARPAARYDPGQDPSLVEVEIARLAALPTDSIPPATTAGRRDNPTVLITGRRKGGGALGLALGIGAGVFVGGLVAVLLMLRARTAPTDPAASVMTAPSVLTPAAVTTMQPSPPPMATTPPSSPPSAAVLPPGPAPVVSAAPSAAMPTPGKVPTATSAPPGAARSSKGTNQSPNDQFSW